MLQAMAETSQDPQIESYLCTDTCVHSGYGLTAEAKIAQKSHCSEMNPLLAPNCLSVCYYLVNLSLNTLARSGLGHLLLGSVGSYGRGLGESRACSVPGRPGLPNIWGGEQIFKGHKERCANFNRYLLYLLLILACQDARNKYLSVCAIIWMLTLPVCSYFNMAHRAATVPMPSHSLWAREEPMERAIFAGSHQHTAAECLGLYLFSGLHAVDCRFPKTEFFETPWVSEVLFCFCHL